MKRRSVLKTLVGSTVGLLVGWRSWFQHAFAGTTASESPSAQTLGFALADASRQTAAPGGETYRDLLLQVRDSFPLPVADQKQDAVFLQQVSQSIAYLNTLKTRKPYLGVRKTADYNRAKQASFPERMASTEAAVKEVASYMDGMIIWSHPDTHRLHGSATSASIIGQLYGSLYDPNLVWDDLSSRVAEAEVAVSAMCADLIGYDPRQVGGVFTFGGTGTTLYGVKVGLEKAQPGAFRDGVRAPMKIIASDGSHYAKLSSAAWLGLGADAVIPVRTDPDNAINLTALEETLRGVFSRGERVAAIIVTMGTTDSFGVDNIEQVVALRDRLTKEFTLSYTPHVHADAVIGWAFSVFNDYDFTGNPMRFPPAVVESLSRTRDRIKALHLADSIGIDFHKSGYSPYMSSMFLAKDRAALNLLARDKARMPYLFQFGDYDPGVYTLECSRSGGPVLAALANLKLFGKEGFRALIGHGVDMASRFREQLRQIPYAVVMNEENQGWVVVFRCYPDGVDAAVTYAQEISEQAQAARLKVSNDYNAKIYAATRQLVEQGEGAVFVRTDRYRATSYGESILGIKCFMLSAFTDTAAIEKAVTTIEKARRMVS
jgi:glutamate/tyrosine decarboxylase-like PLP-dependent enzyme